MKKTKIALVALVSALLMSGCISSGEMAAEYFDNLSSGKNEVDKAYKDADKMMKNAQKQADDAMKAAMKAAGY